MNKNNQGLLAREGDPEQPDAWPWGAGLGKEGSTAERAWRALCRVALHSQTPKRSMLDIWVMSTSAAARAKAGEKPPAVVTPTPTHPTPPPTAPHHPTTTTTTHPTHQQPEAVREAVQLPAALVRHASRCAFHGSLETQQQPRTHTVSFWQFPAVSGTFWAPRRPATPPLRPAWPGPTAEHKNAAGFQHHMP